MESMYLLIWLHIGVGSIGLTSGALALSVPKGFTLHRKVGNIFFVSMTIMALSGSLLAYNLPDTLSLLVGIFTFYLVATSWMAVTRKIKSPVYFNFSTLLIALFLVVGFISSGIDAANSENGLKDGYPPANYFFFGGIAGIAAMMDIVLIARGSISGKHRLIRHLWRMSFALFIATASFFIGQQQVFPVALKDRPILLALPVLMVIVSLFFWLLRVLLSSRYKNA